jgi:hypothetical protein
MTSTSLTPPATTTVVRVSPGRRLAVGTATLLASALPLVWGTASALQLATGTEADHRFHQVTGQGLLLAALWLGGVLPLGWAGLRGRRPATPAALQHLAFVAATLLAVPLAPGNGVVAVGAITAASGALLWAALPVTPDLRGAFRDGLDPVLAPVALLTAAVVVPFALGDAELQRGMVDEHAEMTHYFDMAWVTFVLVAMAAVGALSARARVLAVGATAGLLLTGVSRLVFTTNVMWSWVAIVLGAAGLAVALLRERAEKAA